MRATRIASMQLLAATVLLVAAAARAESFASSASSASSASIGSLSTSIGKSSDASSGRGGQLAAGDYRVVEVAALDGRPGTLRVRLRALDAQAPWQEFDLYLAEQAVPAGGLDAGQTLTVGARDYGFAFAKAGAAEAFFLVLEDGWFRELRNRAVAL